MLSKEEESQMIKAQLDSINSDYERALAKKMAEEQDRIMKQQAAAQQQLQYPPMIPKPRYPPYAEFAGQGTFHTTTGNPTLRDHGIEVAKIVTNHGDGYFSDIRITQEDYIQYKLFRGGFIGRLLYKFGWKEPRDEEGCKIQWEALPGQSAKDRKLEVMLGKTYLKIDELIAEDNAIIEHEAFIMGIADTDPENLKMIAGLKVLDEGMTKPLDDPKPILNGVSQKSPSIAIAKAQAVASAWHPGQDANIVMNGREVVKIDGSGQVSFGDEIQKAITAIAVKETELLKSGKAS